MKKNIERRNVKLENNYKEKQDMYVELISLFGKVLKGQKDEFSQSDINLLIDRINLISITGNTDVVKVLNEYIDTWGKKMQVNKIISIANY